MYVDDPQSTIAALERFILALALGAPFCVVISAVLKRDFYFRVKRNDAKSPSSHYDVGEFTNITNLDAYAKMYAFSLAGLMWFGYAALSISWKLNQIIQEILKGVLATFSHVSGIERISTPIEELPSPVALLLLMILISFCFFPHIRMFFKFAKEIVHNGIGFDNTCDRLVGTAAEEALSRYTYEQLRERFKSHDHLPREMSDSSEVTKVAYLFLDVATKDAPRSGLLMALQGLLRSIAVETTLTATPPRVIRVSAVVVILASYIVAAAVYCGIIPFIGHAICGDVSCHMPIIGDFLFPKFGDPSTNNVVLTSLTIEVVQFSLQVVLPFISGIILFERRRRSVANIGYGEVDFIPVAGFQIAISVCFGLICQILTCLYSWIIATPAMPSIPLVSFSNLLNTFLPCIVAPLLTLLWTKMAQSGSYRVFAVLPIAVIGGIIYGGIGFCYGCLTNQAAVLVIEGSVLAVYFFIICGTLWALTYSRQQPRLQPDDKPSLLRALQRSPGNSVVTNQL